MKTSIDHRSDKKRPSVYWTIQFMITLMLVFSPGNTYSREYDFDIVFPDDTLKYGYGIEGRLSLFNFDDNKGIRFIVNGPDHLLWRFRPDTLYESGQTILAIKTSGAYFNGVVSFEVIGIHHDDSIKKLVNIYIKGEDFHPSYTSAKAYMQQSLDYLISYYPEFEEQFNQADTTGLFCYYPYPSLDIVKHTVLLNRHWRALVQEHVMVPPYNWKKVFLWNEEQNLYFGLEIDTHGDISRIPCKVKYYFENINYLPLEIILSNNTIQGGNTINEPVGSFSTTDNFDTLSYSYRIVNRNMPFLTSPENELQAAAVFNYDCDTVFYIDILSINEIGYGLVQSFAITVTQIPVPTQQESYTTKQLGYRRDGNTICFNTVYDKIEMYDLTGKMIGSGTDTSTLPLEGIEKRIVIIRLYHSVYCRSIRILI